MEIKNWDHVNDAMGKLIANRKEIDRQMKEFDKKTSSWTRKVDNAREKMLQKTDPLDQENKELEEQITEFQKEKQTVSLLDLKNGTLKMRQGKSKVGFMENETNDSALEKVKKFFRDRYVRVKEELNKQLIVADFDNKKVNNQKLGKAGLFVTREKSYSFELKS